MNDELKQLLDGVQHQVTDILLQAEQKGKQVSFAHATPEMLALNKQLNAMQALQFETLKITNGYERALVLKIAQFPDAVQTAAETYMPSVICEYVYSLAKAFNTFYANCPIAKLPVHSVKDNELQVSRLTLTAITAKTIKQCLTLLGIQTVEQM